ncbi:MAG: hypothetical protein GW939_01640 [Candidatus Magasanikbacteria bacterium]|uniref:Cupin type-1 domain-containing protein n=1 Tax=Candidatus Magasanikbacteria bacterium CG10_big_fil_rev_8_21_14_0_10_38_6 TaxID=1974647 RepID=A0A2M6P027_9BACT|nr:hypothetical protein [Candidatus Magasanikbacteria bacterium]NCS72398.1 hypothetical protein [Candidatus Magasanikbacteria bacterium]PIR77064.1 MAG: hypothetical protein COU30_04480 [Candidatus Magasanikbacteria bacterium CG10_big_fil_rev_8_21_14_0_10_38_6]
MTEQPFITTFTFKDQAPKEGRNLKSVKVGEVYISRAELEPYAIIGNAYFHSTNIMMFVEKGKVQAKYKSIDGQKEQEQTIDPGSVVVHIPEKVAFALKNMDDTKTVVVMFSDKPIQSSDDEHEYILYT